MRLSRNAFDVGNTNSWNKKTLTQIRNPSKGGCKNWDDCIESVVNYKNCSAFQDCLKQLSDHGANDDDPSFSQNIEARLDKYTSMIFFLGRYSHSARALSMLLGYPQL